METQKLEVAFQGNKDALKQPMFEQPNCFLPNSLLNLIASLVKTQHPGILPLKPQGSGEGVHLGRRQTRGRNRAGGTLPAAPPAPRWGVGSVLTHRGSTSRMARGGCVLLRRDTIFLELQLFLHQSTIVQEMRF